MSAVARPRAARRRAERAARKAARKAGRIDRAFDLDMLRGAALVMTGLGPGGKTALSIDVSALDAVNRQRLYREWRRSTEYEVVVAHECIVGAEPGSAVARYFFRDGTEILWTIDDGPVAGTWRSEWRVERAGAEVARAVADLESEHARRGALAMDGRWTRSARA